MAIYDKPTKTLMKDFAEEKVKMGEIFNREDAVRWFAEHYPKIKPITVRMHVEAMAVNAGTSRKHHRNIRPGSGHDLFFKLSSTQYRLWDATADPAPIYGESTSVNRENIDEVVDAPTDEPGSDEGAKEFAFERDLRNYLARNLQLIESGLKVYEEEDISGIEFPVGGRFIDILAIDRNNNFVVIELKVSRGYDRTIGQLLRYMGWIDSNLGIGKRSRGAIVASHITDDLKLAAARIEDVRLFEYQLSLTLKPAL